MMPMPPTPKKRAAKRNPQPLPASSDGTALLRAAPACWTFLTNHAHVLVILFQNPSMVMREIALLVGITERAVQRIVQELEQEGFIRREKIGRKNSYQVMEGKFLRHPVEGHCSIRDLLALVQKHE